MALTEAQDRALARLALAVGVALVAAIVLITAGVLGVGWLAAQ